MQLPALHSRSAVAATVLYFAFNGTVIGAYAASIPALRERVGVPGPTMSILFIALGLSAIAGMQVCGRLADRIGARPLALGSVPLLIVGLLGLAVAPTFPLLFPGAIVLGFANGAIDVAMNALGVQVEKARPRPIMSFFHGTWSMGNTLGALIVLLYATLLVGQRDAVVVASAVTAAVIGVAALAALWRLSPTTQPVDHVDEGGARRKIPTAMYLLGLMAIAFGLGEGAAMDWSGLLIQHVAGVDAAAASMSVVAIAAFMTVIRLVGDRAVERFGRRQVVRFGGVCAAIGYFVAAFVTPLPLLLVGWGLVGLGVGMIAPQVYAVAGHEGGGRGLAVVVTFGYVTFLAGPAVIGGLVALLGIQHAMIVPAVLLSGLVFLARVMPADDRTSA